MAHCIKSLVLSAFILAQTGCTGRAPAIVEAKAPEPPATVVKTDPPEPSAYQVIWYRGDEQIGAGLSATLPEPRHTTIPTYVFNDLCQNSAERTFTDETISGGVPRRSPHRVLTRQVAKDYDCAGLSRPR